LSKEGWQADAFYPADGVVTAPPDIQAMDADARLRQRCEHPQCGGIAADHVYQPSGQGPFETDASHPTQSQIANQKSQIPRMFPKTRTVNTASQWETAFGGGVKAVGVGAGVTGFGGQLIIIDDPVKSRAEAESPTYRERLWDWYRNDLYTRLEPNAAVILIQTRWHQDDLAGRLLQEMQTGADQWEVIDLPALSEPRAVATGDVFNAETQRRGESRKTIASASQPTDPEESQTPSKPPRLCVSALKNHPDPLGRPAGAALCPDRFDEEKLADIQRQLGSYNFSALYQQHPIPADGGIFRRAWFTKFVDRTPDGLKWKRGYDLAVSTKTNSCYTASFRVARDEATGNLYIADGFRERIEYPDQKRFIIDRLMAERDTEHGIEKPLHGQALIQELRRETRLFGRHLRGIDVTADKVTRALTWAPLAEEGKVILVRGDWNRAFLDEIANFPAGQHDDQIDAVSLAFSMLEKKGRGMCTF
jgi:predicted phage terminase large subunit-like protein